VDHQGRRPYRRDDADNESVQDLRELFLKAYSEHDSSLLLGLCKGPLKAFKALDNADKDDWDLVRQYSESAGLVQALSKWAKAHYLTWKGVPSSWVMNAALATLERYVKSRTRRYRLRWFFAVTLHLQPPTAEEGFVSVFTGEPESSLLPMPQIEIDPWNWTSESLGEFTKRFNRCCKLARESYIKEMKAIAAQWSTRKKIERTEYLEGLAMWQSGCTLNEIQEFMRTKGMHTGDSRDKSAISYAIRKTARVIQVDPRPGNRVLV
jgi:hypothetical protein